MDFYNCVECKKELRNSTDPHYLFECVHFACYKHVMGPRCQVDGYWLFCEVEEDQRIKELLDRRCTKEQLQAHLKHVIEGMTPNSIVQRPQAASVPSQPNPQIPQPHIPLEPSLQASDQSASAEKSSAVQKSAPSKPIIDEYWCCIYCPTLYNKKGDNCSKCGMTELESKRLQGT